MRLVPLSTDGRVVVAAPTAPAPGPLRVVLEPDVAGVVVVALGHGPPRPVGRLSGNDAAAYGPVLGRLGTRGLRGTCPARMTDNGTLVLELAPAAGCVFGNSPDGLVLLPAERTVTVTREEHHQDVLAGRAGRVAVGLRRSTITAGKYAGQPGVEVTLDGQRVGELTRLMAERYLPTIDGVAARGGRAGCEALVRRDKRGVQVELRLPGADATVGLATAVLPPPGPRRPAPPPPTAIVPAWAGPGTPVRPTARTPVASYRGGGGGPASRATGTTVVDALPVPTTVAPAPPLFPAPPPHEHTEAPRRQGRRRVVYAGVAVVGVLLFASTVGNGTKGDIPASTTSAAGATTSPTPSAITSTPPTSAAPTAVPVAEPAPAPAVAPAPRTANRVSNAPAAPRTTTPKPAKPPTPKPTTTKPTPPKSNCHPSYTPCLPVRNDMNCPEVGRRVKVIGPDVYGLDRGGEPGVGCENY